MRFPNGMVNKRQLFSSLLWRRKQLQTFTPEDVAVSEREKHAENNVCFEALERDLHRYFSLLRQHEGKEGQQAYLTGSLRQELGFSFAVRNSVLSSPKAGYGLFLNGHLSKGRVACMYPGVIYRPGDPMLLFTFANSYTVFCADGTVFDGKPTGLSRYMYRSMAQRNGFTFYCSGEEGQEEARRRPYCDLSWLDAPFPSEEDQVEVTSRNPFALGHMINHHLDSESKEKKKNAGPNVMYCEYTYPSRLVEEFRDLIPNIYYGEPHPLVCCVVAVFLLAFVFCFHVVSRTFLLRSFFAFSQNNKWQENKETRMSLLEACCW
ncbi:SET domain-containing protein 9, variant 2 [Balamuthia mandrillaris]